MGYLRSGNYRAMGHPWLGRCGCRKGCVHGSGNLPTADRCTSVARTDADAATSAYRTYAAEPTDGPDGPTRCLEGSAELSAVR